MKKRLQSYNNLYNFFTCTEIKDFLLFAFISAFQKQSSTVIPIKVPLDRISENLTCINKHLHFGDINTRNSAPILQNVIKYSRTTAYTQSSD